MRCPANNTKMAILPNITETSVHTSYGRCPPAASNVLVLTIFLQQQLYIHPTCQIKGMRSESSQALYGGRRLITIKVTHSDIYHRDQNVCKCYSIQRMLTLSKFCKIFNRNYTSQRKLSRLSNFPSMNYQQNKRVQHIVSSEHSYIFRWAHVNWQ